jgi:hypothetical protein
MPMVQSVAPASKTSRRKLRTAMEESRAATIRLVRFKASSKLLFLEDSPKWINSLRLNSKNNNTFTDTTQLEWPVELLHSTVSKQTV